MQNAPSKDKITELLEEQHAAKLCVSIYVPTHVKSSPDHLQADRIRYKNKLRTIRDQLDNKLQHDNDLQAMYQKLHDLYENREFWKYRSHGLAIFASAQSFHTFDLPIEVDEAAYVEDHYVLSPLILTANMFESCHVLSIDIGQPQLFKATLASFKDVTPDSMPADLRSALNITDYEQEQQYHGMSKGGPAAQYHGQGAAKDHKEEDMVEYLRMIDTAIHEKGVLTKKDPLILAGTVEHIAQFKQITKHTAIANHQIHGNFKQAIQDLESKTLQYLMQKIRRDLQVFKQEYEQARGGDKYAKGAPAKLMHAAHRGRIKTLALRMLLNTRDKVEESMQRVPRIDLSMSDKVRRDTEKLVQTVYQQNGQIIGLFVHSDDKRYARAVLRY